VIVLTTVTWQIKPRPPVLATLLLQVVVGPIVAADALPAKASELRRRSPPVRRMARERRMSTPGRVERRG
jgi:hypothetical protein